LKQQRLEEERERVRLTLRSQVLQRDLPRPLIFSKSFQDFKAKNPDPLLEQAEDMLRQEIIQLISHESVKYPLKQCKMQVTQDYQECTLEELEGARKLVAEEVDEVKSQKTFSQEEFDNAWSESTEEFMYIPSQRKFLRASVATKKDKIDSITRDFEVVKALMDKEATRAKKLEQKLNIYNGGYQNRATNLLHQIQGLFAQIGQSYTELECFSKLQELESRAISSRIEVLSVAVKEQEDREAVLQRKYLNLLTQRDDVLSVGA